MLNHEKYESAESNTDTDIHNYDSGSPKQWVRRLPHYFCNGRKVKKDWGDSQADQARATGEEPYASVL